MRSGRRQAGQAGCWVEVRYDGSPNEGFVVLRTKDTDVLSAVVDTVLSKLERRVADDADTAPLIALWETEELAKLQRVLGAMTPT